MLIDLFPGRRFDGLLFDMDGTLLTSIGASTRVWSRWAARFELDCADFLPRSHGMRVVEVIERLALPGVDPAEEAQIILDAELEDMEGVAQVPGAAAFLDGLPLHRWSIVTSAPRVLAERRLAVAGLPIPPVLITAEEIERGKPDPSCFRLAAQRLEVAPQRCLVFEDAPAGVAAARAAGAQVVTITAAHPGAIVTDGPHMPDYCALRVVASPLGGWALLVDAAGDVSAAPA